MPMPIWPISNRVTDERSESEPKRLKNFEPPPLGTTRSTERLAGAFSVPTATPCASFESRRSRAR